MIDINNLKNCRSYDESMIERFMEEPEYADELLNDVLADGDEREIQRVQEWYNEAKTMDINNLKSCVDHEESTIRSFIRDPENEAIGTIKAAMA